MFFLGQYFAKFQLEKYNFNLFKGFHIEKNGPNSPNFEKKKVSKLPDFNDKFQKVAKNTEGFRFLLTFISSM
jgi:hypothetical protein